MKYPQYTCDLLRTFLFTRIRSQILYRIIRARVGSGPKTPRDLARTHRVESTAPAIPLPPSALPKQICYPAQLVEPQPGLRLSTLAAKSRQLLELASSCALTAHAGCTEVDSHRIAALTMGLRGAEGAFAQCALAFVPSQTLTPKYISDVSMHPDPRSRLSVS